MTRTISQDTANKLSKAAAAVQDHVDNGLTAIAAMQKIAESHNLSPSQIDLVARAYNSGAVIAHRSTGSSLEEKFAAVDLIDTEKLRQPSDKLGYASDVVSSIYDKPYQKTVKIASEVQKPRYKNDDLPTHIKHADCICGCGGKACCVSQEKARVSSENVQRARKKLLKVSELREKCSIHESLFKIAVARLAYGVQKLCENNKNIDKLANYRIFAVEKYGDDGGILIDSVAKRSLRVLGAKEYDKLANEHVNYVQPDRLDTGLFSEIDNVMEKMSSWQKAEREWVVGTLVQRYEANAEMQKSAFNAPQHVDEWQMLPPGSTREDLDREQIEKFASNLLGIASGTAIGEMLGSQGVGQMSSPYEAFDRSVQDAMMDLNAPDHVNKVKAIRAQEMLNDLMQNDSIISSYQPQEVSSAFNELSTSVPSVATNMAVLRANLRRQLQGNLSTFDAAELLKMDKLVNGGGSAQGAGA